MFKPEKEILHGNYFGEYIGDKSRYVESNLKTNELPFEQVKVTPIDDKSNLNAEIKNLIADKYNIDNLRSEADPEKHMKVELYQVKVQQEEGLEGTVFQHNPDKFYRPHLINGLLQMVLT